MNVIDLKKKFDNTVVLTDWKDNKDILSNMDSAELLRLVKDINDYKNSKSVKDIAIIKFEGLPIFIAVTTDDFIPFITFIKTIAIHKQLYELASQTRELEKELLNITV